MTVSGLGHETRLLCLAAGSDNDAEIERAVGAGVNWAHAFRIAERENAFPVFWRRIAPYAGRVAPPAITEQMQKRSLVAEFTLRNQERLLETGLRSLAEIGLEVMLLKGAALATTIYGSFVRRPMGDVDILTHPNDAQRVWDRLLERDWEWHRDMGLDDFYAGHQHLPPLFDRARAGASLEVHTDLFIPSHPFGRLAELVWSDPQPARVGGASTWAPNPNHLMLHACIHFAWSNELERAGWNCIRDVHALSRSGLVDWDELIRVADRVRATTSVYWTLRLARALADAAIPSEVLATLTPPRSTTALALLERHFVAGLFDDSISCPSTRVRRALWETAIEPKRSGHGRARPWARYTEYKPAVAITPPRPEPSRGKQPSAWRRYLQALLARA